MTAKRNLNCPKCGSDRIVPLSEKERNDLKLPSFTLLGYAKCSACNHAWDIPSPRWVWVIGLMLGVGLLIPAVIAIAKGWMKDPGTAYGVGVLAIFGIMILVGILKRLLREKKT